MGKHRNTQDGYDHHPTRKPTRHEGTHPINHDPTLRKLPPTPPHGREGQARARLRDILEGVYEVLASPLLRPLLLLVTMVGIGFIGPYLVVLPILVRDYYGGDIAQLAALNMAFPLGTIFGAGTVLWYGGMRRKGLAQVLALLGGACCVGVLASGLR